MNRTFLIEGEPRGGVYDQLLEVALGSCQFALLVQRETPALSREGIEMIDALDPYLLRSARTAEWPGTRLFGHQATVRVFRFDRPFAARIREMTEGLFEWLHPDRLEDLCLLRGDNDPWLVNIAHEGEAYLILSDEERSAISAQAPELFMRLREVPPLDWPGASS